MRRGWPEKLMTSQPCKHGIIFCRCLDARGFLKSLHKTFGGFCFCLISVAFSKLLFQFSEYGQGSPFSNTSIAKIHPCECFEDERLHLCMLCNEGFIIRGTSKHCSLPMVVPKQDLQWEVQVRAQCPQGFHSGAHYRY